MGWGERSCAARPAPSAAFALSSHTTPFYHSTSCPPSALVLPTTCPLFPVLPPPPPLLHPTGRSSSPGEGRRRYSTSSAGPSTAPKPAPGAVRGVLTDRASCGFITGVCMRQPGAGVNITFSWMCDGGSLGPERLRGELGGWWGLHGVQGGAWDAWGSVRGAGCCAHARLWVACGAYLR